MSSNDVHVIEGINTIPIFNIENVRGKCIVTPNGIQSFVLAVADDIAREGGLIRENPITYVPKQNSEFLTKSGQKSTCSFLHKSGQKIYVPTSGHVNHKDFSDTSVRKTYVYETIIWNRFNKYLNNAIEIALVLPIDQLQ